MYHVSYTLLWEYYNFLTFISYFASSRKEHFIHLLVTSNVQRKRQNNVFQNLNIILSRMIGWPLTVFQTLLMNSNFIFFLSNLTNFYKFKPKLPKKKLLDVTCNFLALFNSAFFMIKVAATKFENVERLKLKFVKLGDITESFFHFEFLIFCQTTYSNRTAQWHVQKIVF